MGYGVCRVWLKGRMGPTHPRPVLGVAGTSAPSHHVILRLVEEEAEEKPPLPASSWEGGSPCRSSLRLRCLWSDNEAGHRGQGATLQVSTGESPTPCSWFL